MPLLHFRITEKNQSINLSRTLHAQNLTLRRSMVVKNKGTVSNKAAITGTPGIGTYPNYEVHMLDFIKQYTTDYEGGICIDASFLKGYEIMSNFRSNDIMIPFGNDETNIDHKYELDLSSEDIALSFNVKTFNFKRDDNVVFVEDERKKGTANPELVENAIHHIDLVFQYDELFNYDTY
jgi:hypothetical protein